ncbi:methyltransferase [Candidatus Epulonipiscium fishelsonii]|uniref:Methyltransferase n=1 Tax=Candidatus Epulonipiscium fishelsonii TaxID=77094 RepID=A0ACC8XEY6_9FIRM|nr:methyltransferase [Epulopiscium sp. SCG-B05WGA-EpuloA1]ONI41949.1 methyltransferase [Epulopiscium sp. SCG-B11WGA-EpuloA1]
MAILEEISEQLKKGKVKIVKEKVQEALDQGIDPKEVLEEGLIKTMNEIGVKFKNNEIYVPEVLIAARAMNAGLAILEPKLVEAGAKPLGKVVLGTVKGDLHDIGKNLVGIMLKGAGLEVVDVGVDVSADKFIDTAEKEGASIICMSALLTTTMEYMGEVIKELDSRNLRDKYTVMIGGAPITDEYAKQIHADYYTPDAASAAEVAKRVLTA